MTLQEEEEHKIFSGIEKIVSGGQTGVDRAALDVALELGISCGGWCPNGRQAEDGPIDIRYPIKETHSASYRIRTEKNVRESDGTLIFTWREPKGGTGLTIKFAQEYRKPCFVVDLSAGGDPESVQRWGEVDKINYSTLPGYGRASFPVSTVKLSGFFGKYSTKRRQKKLESHFLSKLRQYLKRYSSIRG